MKQTSSTVLELVQCDSYMPLLLVLRPKNPASFVAAVRRKWMCYEYAAMRNAHKVLADPWPRTAANESAAFHWMNRRKRDAILSISRLRAGQALREVAIAIEQACDDVREAASCIVDNPKRVIASALKGHLDNDLVSDLSIALLRCVDLFDPTRGVRFSTYLYRALFSAAGRARSQSRHEQTTGVAGDIAALTAAPIDHTAADRDEAAYVERLVARLPAKQRQVIAMQYGIGNGGAEMEASEVAASLGCSKQNVYRIRSDAINRMRRMASGRGGE